jgi:hypothetical protein
MPEMQPDLNHRAEMLLDFWFAPERASEHDRLRDIWFQATPEFDAALAAHFRADYDRSGRGLRTVADRTADLPGSDSAAGPASAQSVPQFAAGLRHGRSSARNRQ